MIYRFPTDLFLVKQLRSQYQPLYDGVSFPGYKGMVLLDRKVCSRLALCIENLEIDKHRPVHLSMKFAHEFGAHRFAG